MAKILRKGDFIHNGKRVYWQVKDTGRYPAALYMRVAGQPYNFMGTVHSSIASAALRNYASDYLRWLKGGITQQKASRK